MEITEVRITTLDLKKSSLKAFASVTFNDCFVVTGFKVVDGEKGLFVSMPSRQGEDEEYYDTAFPITADFREELISEILEAYEEKAAEEDSPKSKKKRK